MKYWLLHLFFFFSSQSGDKTFNCCCVLSSALGHYPMAAGGKQPHGLEWILSWGFYLYLGEKSKRGQWKLWE